MQICPMLTNAFLLISICEIKVNWAMHIFFETFEFFPQNRFSSDKCQFQFIFTHIKRLIQLRDIFQNVKFHFMNLIFEYQFKFRKIQFHLRNRSVQCVMKIVKGHVQTSLLQYWLVLLVFGLIYS